jgi:ABC-2 type transport system ATP-binding protein
MRQRLGLAGALLADPGILVLDEPTNGLDPLGIRWIRQFLKDMAREGRCVLVSSHQLSELEATADRVVMIHRGKLIADVDMGAEGTTGGREVVVGSPHAARLVPLVESAGGSALLTHDQELVVTGLPGKRIGEVAAAAGVVLHSWAERGVGLEETFLRLAGADGAASAPDGSAARAAEPVVPAEESTGGGR